MLQKKIYDSQSPFNFDKLFAQDRFFVFPDVQAYLAFKKDRGTLNHDEGIKEIILVSSANLRLGDSAYWLHNLNKNFAQSGFVLLTDATLASNDLLMKPFTAGGLSKLRVFHNPIDTNLTGH
jgi:hypothetical protein